jgi:amino acid transporter
MMAWGALTMGGMFEAEMSSDAWLVAGMAERGILPKWVGQRNQFGTPTYGIGASCCGVVVLCWMHFSDVQLLNLLFCIGQIIEFAAFLELRRSRPDMNRPYKIPLGFGALCLMVALPCAFILVIISFSSDSALMVAFSVAFLGIPLHRMLETYKSHFPLVFL